MKKVISLGLLVVLIVISIVYINSQQNIDIPFNLNPKVNIPITKNTLIVPSVECPVDKDNDTLDDLKDIIGGARAEVERQPNYHSAYYAGGYPPDDEGVCTDLVWRSFRDAGYNLKELVDKDIKNNINDYPRVEGKAEPNIDFRRVPNLLVFFKKYATNLVTVIKPNDIENLSEWQGGDIVIFGSPLWHIAIVSDKRRSDGVPYIIHNSGPTPREEDYILDWPSPMVGHFRFPKY
ncbi:MAG: DUF1287 domain-containing protein [Peptococcaceae bacterium]